MTGALDGIRVIEVCRYISGPYAGKLLADLGAEVIKVEEAGIGDPFREWQRTEMPYSPQFAAYNRNKKSVAVDFKAERGRDLVRRLAVGADVLLENSRPGAMDRLGLGWPELQAANPRLVYCSITGFGASGPYALRPSYDSITSALSGFYSMIFDPDRPVPVGPPMSDLTAGLFSTQAILAALVARGRTGQGQRVEVSMLGAMLAFLTEPASTWLALGDVYGPDSRPRRAQVYAFISKDGLPFLVHLSTPHKFWRSLAEVTARPDLLQDDRFSDRHKRYENYYALDGILKLEMQKRTRADWFERLQAADIPFAPIYRMDEVFEDPQVQAMNLTERAVIPGMGEVTVLGNVIGFSDTSPAGVRGAPLLGEHTDSVLATIGCAEDDIRALRLGGVVA